MGNNTYFIKNNFLHKSDSHPFIFIQGKVFFMNSKEDTTDVNIKRDTKEILKTF